MVDLKSRRAGDILVFVIGLLAIIILNQLAARYPLRLDLTEEKRYSISQATDFLVSNLDDVVYIDVYLDGELPSGFQRLQRAIIETLEEFKVRAGNRIQYQFINPEQARSQQSRNEFMQYLANRGIQPTNVFANEGGQRTQRLIFPGAIISYYGEERGVLLLKGNQGAGPEEILNQSIEGVEYELANAIRTLAQSERKLVGMVSGHNELDSLELAGFTNALLQKYDVFNVNLARQGRDLSAFDALMVVKPSTPFTELEKYQLDQYVINGGKAMFFVDAVKVNMDSAGGEGTVAIPNEINLRDLLFRWGVRINENLIQDLNSGQYPVVAGNIGDQPQISLLPWPFFPVANQFGEHPIVRNMDAVYTKFVSNIDTVKAAGIKKTPLVYTSQYSRVLDPPVRVAFNDLQQELSPEMFNAGPQPVAVLLEGAFTSVFKNRTLPGEINESSFKDQGNPSKIVVIADGDLVRNEINIQNDQPLDLGYDQFRQITYANKDFIMNSLEYLLDDNGIITARNKEVEIRPLDKVKVEEERTWWQMFNLMTPIIVLLLFGYTKYHLRRRKYAKF